MPSQALILKGGGVKGLAFAGVVQELEQHGRTFDIYVGTSAGALAAVLLATGFTGKQLEVALLQLDFAQFRDSTFLRAWLLNLPFRGWLYPGWRLTQWVDDLLKAQLGRTSVKLRDLPLRAVVFATRRDRGTVVFDSHADHQDSEAAYAVRCSASIPIFFEPGRLDGHRIFDGGLLNNYPVDAFHAHEQQRGAASVSDFIAVYLTTETSGPYEPQSFIRDVVDIYLNRDDRFVVQRYRDRTIVVNPAPIGTTSFSISNDEKKLLLLRGRLAAVEFLVTEKLAVARSAGRSADPIQRLLAMIKTDEASALDRGAQSLRSQVSDLEDKVRAAREKRRARRRWSIVLLIVVVLALLAVFWASRALHVLGWLHLPVASTCVYPFANRYDGTRREYNGGGWVIRDQGRDVLSIDAQGA